MNLDHSSEIGQNSLDLSLSKLVLPIFRLALLILLGELRELGVVSVQQCIEFLDVLLDGPNEVALALHQLVERTSKQQASVNNLLIDRPIDFNPKTSVPPKCHGCTRADSECSYPRGTCARLDRAKELESKRSVVLREGSLALLLLLVQ